MEQKPTSPRVTGNQAFSRSGLRMCGALSVAVVGRHFSPRLCYCLLQSDLGGSHGDCVKAICGGED